jgi:hypothetical protein
MWGAVTRHRRPFFFLFCLMTMRRRASVPVKGGHSFNYKAHVVVPDNKTLSVNEPLQLWQVFFFRSSPRTAPSFLSLFSHSLLLSHWLFISLILPFTNHTLFFFSLHPATHSVPSLPHCTHTNTHAFSLTHSLALSHSLSSHLPFSIPIPCSFSQIHSFLLYALI